MELSSLWRWLGTPEQSLDEIAEVEGERREEEKRRQETIDQYYEEGFPSQEVVKASLWSSLWPL